MGYQAFTGQIELQYNIVQGHVFTHHRSTIGHHTSKLLRLVRLGVLEEVRSSEFKSHNLYILRFYQVKGEDRKESGQN